MSFRGYMIKKTTTSGACGHLNWFVEDKGVRCCKFKEVGFDGLIVLPWIATESQTVESIDAIGIVDFLTVSNFGLVTVVFDEFNL